jgi:transcriptional regulator with XRE-family HTH domain
MKLGDAIKLIRTARKQRQVVLAKQVGVSPNYFSMVEANKRVPSLEFLEKVAAELEVPAGLFLLWAESERANAKPAQVKKLRDLLVRIQAIYLETDDSSKKPNDDTESAA